MYHLVKRLLSDVKPIILNGKRRCKKVRQIFLIYFKEKIFTNFYNSVVFLFSKQDSSWFIKDVFHDDQYIVLWLINPIVMMAVFILIVL